MSRWKARWGISALLGMLFGVLCCSARAQSLGSGGLGTPRPGLRKRNLVLAKRNLVSAKRDLVSAKSTLSRRSALSRGRRLLRASGWRERVRGIERLGTSSERAAWQSLVEVMHSGEAVYEDARSRLAAVRVLSRHLAHKPVRRVLSTVLQQARDGAAESPQQSLARGTAAMALARHGVHKPLLTALLAGGPGAEPAREALRAYPPARFEDFVGKTGRLSVVHIRWLGELGDLRAIPVLRKQRTRKRDAVRWAAATALAGLGDESVLPEARRWLRDKRSDARLVAAEIFALLDAPEFSSAIKPLLSSKKTRDRALALIERAPRTDLIEVMTMVARSDPSVSRRRRVIRWLATGMTVDAIESLATFLDDPELSHEALFALGRSQGEAARLQLARRLATVEGRAKAERDVLRACLFHGGPDAERVAGLQRRLRGQLVGSDPDGRAVGSYGLVLLDGAEATRLLVHADPIVVGAAARAVGRRLPSIAVARFGRDAKTSRERPTLVQLALGAALLADDVEVSSSQLVRWIQGGSPLAPLAAFRLAARDPQRFRPRVRQWLNGSDPLIRAHLGHGLGLSPEPDAVSLLSEAYRFEPRADVRRALVRGLSLRNEALGRAALKLAQQLDPDPEVRALARAALRDVSLDWRATRAGGGSVWVRLEGSDAVRAAQFVHADGLATVVLSDPSGDMMIGGVEHGRAKALWLAPGAYSRKLPPNGSRR